MDGGGSPIVTGRSVGAGWCRRRVTIIVIGPVEQVRRKLAHRYAENVHLDAK